MSLQYANNERVWLLQHLEALVLLLSVTGLFFLSSVAFLDYSYIRGDDAGGFEPSQSFVNP